METSWNDFSFTLHFSFMLISLGFSDYLMITTCLFIIKLHACDMLYSKEG